MKTKTMLDIQIECLTKYGFTVEKYRLGDIWLVFKRDKEVFVGNTEKTKLYLSGMMTGIVCMLEKKDD